MSVGVAQIDPLAYIEYTPGDAPLVIIAPHGGTVRPAGLPDRTCAGCETSNDLETQALARLIVDRFQAATGRRPHLVVNRLHRVKFDANREVDEATGGTAALRAPWSWLHTAVDSAKATVQRQHGRGLVIDLHGHAHTIARLELGYLLDGAALRASDSTLATSGALQQSSVARLGRDTRSATDRSPALLRGPRSLGTLLASRGFAAVPSASDPAPRAGEPFFEGGYNTRRHGSLDGSALDAIQIEAPNAGVRDTEANRERFADAVVQSLRTYLATHYGWQSTS
jgi:N-formylglutamate amidohydrolase